MGVQEDIPRKPSRTLPMEGLFYNGLLMGNLVCMGGLGSKRDVAVGRGKHVTVELFPKRSGKQQCVKPRILKETNLINGELSVHHEVCDNCQKIVYSEELKSCSQCRQVAYCSTKCQNKHWERTHKYDCNTSRQDSSQDEPPSPCHQTPAVRADISLRLASRLAEKHNYAAAEKLLRNRIQELLPVEYFGLYVNLASVVDAQNRLDEAIEYLHHAVGLVTASPETKFAQTRVCEYLASLQERQGNYEEALETYAKIMEIDPTMTIVLPSMGYLHMRLGNYKAAEGLYLAFLREAGPFEDPMQKHADTAGLVYSHLASIMQERMEQRLRHGRIHGLPCSPGLIQRSSRVVTSLFQNAMRLDPAKEGAYKRDLARHVQYMDSVAIPKLPLPQEV